jgi:flagellar L-ring protein precursor FlgH
MVLASVLMSFAASAADLFQEEQYRPLTADRRALRVGDVLTVLVVENSSASASAGTKTDKNADLGLNSSMPGKQLNYSVGLSENFDGVGKIARSGRVAAQLSVAVVALETNGDLYIEGEQNLEINGETQAIRIAGRVRPNDISDTNTIISSRISNANITYVGDGVLAESQHKGWLTRVLSFLGLI